VYGISLEAESEAWTSQTCPECGDHEETVRHGDTLTCPCGFEGHADLTASETFLRENSDRKSGRWHGPCDSSGTTTTGRGNHTPRKSQRSAHKPASCLRGSVAEPPTEESSRFSAGEDVKYGELVPISRDDACTRSLKCVFGRDSVFDVREVGSHILGRNGVVSVDGRVTFLRPLMVVEFCANSGSSGGGCVESLLGQSFSMGTNSSDRRCMTMRPLS